MSLRLPKRSERNEQVRQFADKPLKDEEVLAILKRRKKSPILQKYTAVDISSLFEIGNA